MSLTVRDPPQRRRSLGPVSPKRLYRNLTVRLRCGDATLAGETITSKHPCKAMRPPFKTLWEAVENEDTLAVQSLLLRERSNCGRGGEGGGGNSTWDRREKRKADFHRDRERELNMVSDQGLVPLDVAALTHNAPLLHVLTKAGARHNPVLCRPEEWAVKLDALVALATTQVEEKTEELASKAGMGTQAQADSQRQICLWSLRLQLYCRMRENLQATDMPRPPSNVSILVTSASSLLVTVREPERNSVGLVTRYRVDWSSSASFTSILGTAQVLETKNPTCSITGLKTGVAYFVRASAYNVNGWGPPQCSTPMSAAPSCWRECVGVKSQLRNQEGLKKLLDQTKEPHYAGYCLESCKSQCPSKRMSMSRGIKQLFHSATKFVRLLQRGVYLTTVFYHKENILLTAEDQLPLVEIQCCSTSFTQDFIWFAKLSYAWQQVPWLQQALSSAHSSSSSLLQNRQSILRAISQLQSSLGTEDLGQVYYEPLKDRQGNVLLVTVKAFPHLPYPPDPPLHWAPISHLEKNRSRTALLPEPTAMDTLIDQLKEKLSFHRHSVQWAQPGLYVGILKLCSSVDQIRVLVPQRLPNLLCHARVRHNAHVTRDEWAWLQSHVFTTANGSLQSLLSSANERTTESSGLLEFVRSLRAAVALLLTKLNIPLYRAYQYGVYTRELLQFGDRLSMILLLPPSEDFSSSYWPLVGTKEPGLTMPLQIFELVHFWTYEPDLLSQYCQAWVRLELDTHLAQQNLREALEPSEVQEGRQRLSHITQLSQRLDAVWRDARWIMDCLQCVRSRQWVGAVPLGPVMGGHPAPTPDTQVEEVEESLTARLSWPHQIHRTVSESQASIPENIVSAEVSVPAEDLGERENSASLVLIEGVAKGGYPLDISTQPALDLASITQTELGRESTISPSGIEPAKAVQQDMGCHGAVAVTPYIDDRSFSSSISEVIQPVETRALADILPKRSLITEKEETCVHEPMAQSMMDMFENFGLDIGENCHFFDMVNSELINGAESLSDSEIDMTSELGLAERCYEDRDLQDQDSTAPAKTNATGTATTVVTSDLAKAEDPNNVTFSTVRNQVEWVSSSHTPS